MKEKLLTTFKYNETYGFRKPYEIKKMNTIDALIEEISDDLKYIEKILSGEKVH